MYIKNYSRFIKSILTIALLCLLKSYEFAQESIKGSVYVTFKEFIKNAPSVVVTKKSGNSFNFSPATDIIKIKSSDSTIKFLPGTVYAYDDGKSKYRYYKSSENVLYKGYFKVVEIGQIIIYEKYVYHRSTPGAKVKGLVKTVFYSMAFDSPIRELNQKNLISDFKTNSVAVEEITAMASCKACLIKQSGNSFVINTNLNNLAKKYPSKFKQKPIYGVPVTIPQEQKKNSKGKHIPEKL